MSSHLRGAPAQESQMGSWLVSPAISHEKILGPHNFAEKNEPKV